MFVVWLYKLHICVPVLFFWHYRHHMTGDEDTEREVAFALKLSLKRNPFIIKRLDQRRGADVFETVARQQAKDLLKRWEMKKRPPLKPHGA